MIASASPPPAGDEPPTATAPPLLPSLGERFTGLPSASSPCGSSSPTPSTSDDLGSDVSISGRII